MPPAAAPAFSVSEKNLSRLHPKVASLGRALISDCLKEGISIVITQGLRTWEEQDALYARGRTVPPIGKESIVTKARGGESFHNFGLAFDVCVLDALGKFDWNTLHPAWKQAGVIGQKLGLTWGGAWKTFTDLPHFEYTGGLTLARCRELHGSGGMEAVWKQIP